MKKFILFVAFMLVATSAFAYGVETTENGPQHTTVCYMIGTAAVTSGNVVVLSNDATTQPTGRTLTYYGKEVTGSTALGLTPYGVIVNTEDFSAADMSIGQWVKVQIYGYMPNIKVSTSSTNAAPAITAGDNLIMCNDDTSTSALLACSNNAGGVTGSAVALSAYAAGQTTGTVKGFIGRNS
jgi:hypothetical protein